MSLPAFRHGEQRPPRSGQTTPADHFRGQAIHLLCRVRDHIERLDRGVVYAVDDIAVALRALLHHSHGNRVLLRLASLAGSRDVEIRLSRPPAVGAIFSVGAIPTAEPDADNRGAQWIPLDNWASRPLLRMRVQGKATTYTWGEFLNTYANKWGGAHLDHDVPEPLQIIDLCEVGAFPLSAYLLRSAAVQAWFIGQALLAEQRFVVRDGEALSAAEKTGPRITAPGGIAEDPSDRRRDGELQYLDYRVDGLDMLSYLTPHRQTRIRIQVGKMGYDMHFTPGVDGSESPAEPARAREQVPQQLDPSDFSEGRTIPLRGRFLPFTGES